MLFALGFTLIAKDILNGANHFIKQVISNKANGEMKKIIHNKIAQ